MQIHRSMRQLNAVFEIRDDLVVSNLFGLADHSRIQCIHQTQPVAPQADSARISQGVLWAMYDAGLAMIDRPASE